MYIKQRSSKMEFTIQVKTLKDIIQKHKKLIGKTPIPVLKSVKLMPNEKILKIVSTNLENTLISELPLSVSHEKNEEALIPIEEINSITKNYTPKSYLTISTDKETTTILTESSEFKLKNFDLENAPLIPQLDEVDAKFNINEYEFVDSLKRIAFAMFKEETRPSLMGVNLKYENGKTLMHATDGHRLGKAIIPTKSSKNYNFIIPKETVKYIIQCWKSKSPSKDLEIEVGKINFTNTKRDYIKIINPNNQETLIAMLVDGEYPQVENAFPRSFKYHYEIDKQKLLSAVKHLEPFTDEYTKRLVFKTTENSLTLTAKKQDSEYSTTEIVPCEYGGNGLTIAFNAKYLIDILSKIDGKYVKFNMVNSDSACLIECENPNLQYLLMPIKMRGDE